MFQHSHQAAHILPIALTVTEPLRYMELMEGGPTLPVSATYQAKDAEPIGTLDGRSPPVLNYPI